MSSMICKAQMPFLKGRNTIWKEICACQARHDAMACMHEWNRCCMPRRCHAYQLEDLDGEEEDEQAVG